MPRDSGRKSQGAVASVAGCTVVCYQFLLQVCRHIPSDHMIDLINWGRLGKHADARREHIVQTYPVKNVDVCLPTLIKLSSKPECKKHGIISSEGGVQLHYLCECECECAAMQGLSVFVSNLLTRGPRYSTFAPLHLCRHALVYDWFCLC